ncbi:MAG: tRNA (adenosine(37)-N6)-threonylcarbamoyltransferase complex dimerization subunit type 1 TsaB [Planctomycetaceae bacterium]
MVSIFSRSSQQSHDREITVSLILGIETSGVSGSIALQTGEKRIDARTLSQGGRRHAQSLLKEIDELFRKHSLKPRDCTAVAVSQGPGSFTGLRVGIVCAKTWAYATNGQLAAVDTFLAVAENSPADVNKVFVVENAQRGDLFVGRYRRNVNGHFERTGEIEIVPAQSWIAELNAKATVSGPGLDKYREQISDKCRTLDAASCQPSASQIVKLGAKQLAEGKATDFWEVEPFYLRKSAAEEKWEARQAEQLSD